MQRVELEAILQCDLIAQGLGSRWKIHFIVTKRVAYYQRLLRFAEYRRSKRGFGRLLYFWTRWRLLVIGERLGFDIPLGVFGSGLSIAHPGYIIVNGDVRVGNGCRIHHGVTLGAVRGRSPVIEDDVFISPGVGVYGDVTVGRGSVIGPGVVVREDIPPGSVVTCTEATSVEVRERGPWSNPNLRPRISKSENHILSMGDS